MIRLSRRLAAALTLSLSALTASTLSVAALSVGAPGAANAAGTGSANVDASPAQAAGASTPTSGQPASLIPSHVREASFSALKAAPDHSLFVDEATRFAFVRTADGWQFVRELTQAELPDLGPSTYVARIAPVAD